MNRSSIVAGLMLTGALLASAALMLVGSQGPVKRDEPRVRPTVPVSPPVPVPVAPAPKAKVWAVIVGIDLYDDRSIPPCHGANTNSRELARWFTKTAKWDDRNVLMMNDSGDRRHGRPEDPTRALYPTRENLEWALRQWLGHHARPGDIAVLYFAGQATVVDDRELLLPIDAKASNLAHTGWSPEEAIDDLALKSRCQTVVWLDTSPLGRGRPVARDVTEPAAGVRFLNRLTRWQGVTAWLAADGHPAVEGPGPGHGPFLSALTRGLGTRPSTLQACLEQMHQDPALKRQGFQTRGGISPRLTLWPEDFQTEPQINPKLTWALRQGHADAVTGVALSADGDLMVTASLDSTVRIWRVRDREQVLLHVLPHHMIGVTALALSPDGRYLASGDGKGEVRVWDMAEQREKPKEGGPHPHRRRIASLAFLPVGGDGRFVSLDHGGRCKLWNATGTQLKLEEEQFEAKDPIIRLAAARQKAKEEGQVALALADSDGMLILLDGDGKAREKALPGTGGRPTALHLAADGRRLAAGDEDGRVRVWDVETKEIVFQHDYTGRRIGTVRLGPVGGLAIGAGDRMYLAAPDRDGPGLDLEGVGDEVDSALFSDDGRWLAALTARGDRHLWSVDDLAHPAAHPLSIEETTSRSTCMAFARGGGGERLVTGEGNGEIRSWDLANCRERPPIRSHAGKVADLAVSSDGRFLLQITRDGLALVWDLKEGRGPKILPRRWTSGVFLPNNSQIVMTHDANDGGDVVLVDRESGQIQVEYERPRDRRTDAALLVDFGRVAVDRDGRQVAASAVAGQVEIACVWDVRGGTPRILEEGDGSTSHAGTITALDFSEDGRSLLTASEDGTAKLWNLAPAGPDSGRPTRVVDASPRGAIMAAQVSPADPRRIATAHWDPARSGGEVWLSDWQPGRPTRSRSRKVGDLTHRPHALVFTPDGRSVGVAGQDKRLRFWTLEAGRDTTSGPIDFEPEHQHTEQVKALIAWPTTSKTTTTSMIASGGDDTTVRLWTLDPKTRRGTLLGMLVAVPAPPQGGERRDWSSRPSPSPIADWVAFTPDGIYDSSLEGDRMVNFVLDREVMTLEQYAEKYHKLHLTDDLRQGKRPSPPPVTAPPALVIDPPPVPDLARRETELTISLSDSSFNREELRLYHDGVPVQDGHDFQALDGQGRGHFVARVRLRNGVNRFYAMVGRRGDIDARSRDVEIRYDGRDTPGRLHVLALAVKNYARNALRFSDRDAIRIAEHLHRNRMEGTEPGEKIVLIDDDVNEEKVKDAFAAIRRAVEGRPEDTVVVFLAGHTDVLKDEAGRERFSLLLPQFPFPQAAPAIVANRGVAIGVADPPPPGMDLPFSLLYGYLSHFDALQRLIIVDACQAEAIHDDPGVLRIRQAIEKDSRRARTTYLLAARRGELANESAILEHGLLTYVLLHGMRAPELRPLPISLPTFQKAPHADLDGDGIVNTRELCAYANRMLPVLASGLAGVAAPPEPVRFQASETAAFRLVTLPKVEAQGD